MTRKSMVKFRRLNMADSFPIVGVAACALIQDRFSAYFVISWTILRHQNLDFKEKLQTEYLNNYEQHVTCGSTC